MQACTPEDEESENYELVKLSLWGDSAPSTGTDQDNLVMDPDTYLDESMVNCSFKLSVKTWRLPVIDPELFGKCFV